MAKYLYRKCRREACSKWSAFAQESPGQSCPHCRAAYGRLELGLDTDKIPPMQRLPKSDDEGEA